MQNRKSFLLWIFQKLLAFVDQIFDDCSLGLKLVERLLLSFNQLFDILNATWGNVSSRTEHDAVQELNVGLELIAVSVAFPVEVDLDLGGCNCWNLE